MKGKLSSRWSWCGLLPLVFILMAGCGLKEISPEFSLAPHSKEAVVVVSVTRSGVREFQMTIHLTGVGHGYSEIVQASTIRFFSDFKGDPGGGPTPAAQPEGRLIVFRVPPGEYRFDTWYGESGDWGHYSEGYSIVSDEIDLRFRAERGKVNYIGNIHFDLADDIYYTRNGVYQIRSLDTNSRDLALFRSKYPRLATAAVKFNPLQNRMAGRKLQFYLHNHARMFGRRRAPGAGPVFFPG